MFQLLVVRCQGCDLGVRRTRRRHHNGEYTGDDVNSYGISLIMLVYSAVYVGWTESDLINLIWLLKTCCDNDSEIAQID